MKNISSNGKAIRNTVSLLKDDLIIIFVFEFYRDIGLQLEIRVAVFLY